ncbi:MAG: hypothetical protein LBV13_01845 [Methanomassiliicoccaceae archaeon]|jgi:hypothetical protein|nr:hypothetical protein [Methanomassiliicoccaceae archaeon]
MAAVLIIVPVALLAISLIAALVGWGMKKEGASRFSGICMLEAVLVFVLLLFIWLMASHSATDVSALQTSISERKGMLTVSV